MFKKILLTSNQVFERDNPAYLRALSLCSAHSASLDVLITLTIPCGTFDTARWQCTLEDIQQKLAENVQSKMSQVLSEQQSKVQCFVEFGKLYLTTIHRVQNQGYDLVLKVAETPSWLDHLFDSDDLHLIRKCKEPVWMIDGSRPQRCERIAVAVDFDHSLDSDNDISCSNRALLDYAATIAAQDNATLQLIHILDPGIANFVSMWGDDRDDLEQELLRDARLESETSLLLLKKYLRSPRTVQNYSGLKIETYLEQGAPKQMISELVSRLDSDLLVMGTVGRIGVKGMIIGNTAESVMLQLNTSLFAIKPEGFISPV